MNLLSKCQLPSCYGLGDIFRKDDQLSELMNDKAVCRTALAPRGLLTKDIPPIDNIHPFVIPHFALLNKTCNYEIVVQLEYS